MPEMRGRIFAVRKERRQTDRRRISRPAVRKGMMYIRVRGGFRRQVGARTMLLEKDERGGKREEKRGDPGGRKGHFMRKAGS